MDLVLCVLTASKVVYGLMYLPGAELERYPSSSWKAELGMSHRRAGHTRKGHHKPKDSAYVGGHEEKLLGRKPESHRMRPCHDHSFCDLDL